MIAVFQIGDIEKHKIEVELRFFNWSAAFLVSVDGIEVIQKPRRYFAKTRIHLEVGSSEKHTLDIEYTPFTLTSQVYVDGNLYIGCLFPELVGLAALFGVTVIFLIVMFEFLEKTFPGPGVLGTAVFIISILFAFYCFFRIAYMIKHPENRTIK